MVFCWVELEVLLFCSGSIDMFWKLLYSIIKIRKISLTWGSLVGLALGVGVVILVGKALHPDWEIVEILKFLVWVHTGWEW